jgi:hypothetical protein
MKELTKQSHSQIKKNYLMTEEVIWKKIGNYTLGQTSVEVFKAADRVGCIMENRTTNDLQETTYYNCPKGLKTNFEETFLKSLELH